MKFGICTGLTNLNEVQNLNIDFFESSVGELNSLSKDEFQKLAKDLKQSSIKCEALNILFPGTLPVVGSNIDMDEIKNHLNNTFNRAEIAGVNIIVFGSGASRFCPDGFSKENAIEQLCEIGYILGETAKDHGIQIALEPICRNDTNMINTVEEGLELVNKVSHPNFKLLADYYHMMLNNEDVNSILKCKDVLIHTHIASIEGRLYPLNAANNYYESFFNVLEEIGYNSRMSIEAHTDNMNSDAPNAMKYLRNF